MPVELKPINCSACGGELTRYTKKHVDDEETWYEYFAKCKNCGKLYDYKTQEYYSIWGEVSKPRGNMPFKLGMKGSINGIECEIIGRVRYMEEDDESPTDTLWWDEWLLATAKGYMWLTYEEGEFYLYKKYVPEDIIDTSHGAYIIFEGHKIYYNDDNHYYGHIIHAEGELYWQPEIGESKELVDFKLKDKYYSIELSKDELEIYVGEKISFVDLCDAFGLDEWKAKFLNLVKKAHILKIKKRIYYLAMVVFFFIFFVNVAHDGKVIFSNAGIIKDIAYSKYKVKDIKALSIKGHKLLMIKGNRGLIDRIIYGPINIPQGNNIVQLSFKYAYLKSLYLEDMEITAKLIRSVDELDSNAKQEIDKAYKKAKTELTLVASAYTNNTVYKWIDYILKDLYEKGSEFFFIEYANDLLDKVVWPTVRIGRTRKRTSTKPAIPDSLQKLYHAYSKFYNTLDLYTTVFALVSGFWDEEGYDEGYWHQNETHTTEDFVIDRAGKYYLYITAESYKFRYPHKLTNKDATDVIVTIRYGLRSYTYYLLASIVFLIIALIMKGRITALGWKFPFYIKVK